MFAEANTMKLSIITTIYKAENDLPRLLDSMMAQTSEELEFFLIDNGSPDKCGEICREYAKRDKRFTVYTIEQNVGYIRARNIGMKECSGDYIGFCDSDDYLEVGGYDRAIQKIKENDCDLYITSYRTVLDNGQIINNMPYDIGLYQKEDIKSVILPQAFGYIDGKNALHGFAWKQIFKRSLILDNGFTFLPELQPYEDQIFNIDVINKCNRIYIDDNILYNYIVNQQSITAKLITNFNAEAEWNRIVLFWKEKQNRAIEAEHIEACSNQVLSFIYSLILNITKSNKMSIHSMVRQLQNVVDDNIIMDVLNHCSVSNGRRLDFVKSCLQKRKYRRLFTVICVGLFLRK